MRALVTGGTGFLGSHIARLLLERGTTVRISYAPGDSTRAVGELAVEHRPADLLDPPSLRSLFEGVEVVFHTAALVTFDPRRYRRQLAINVEGTRRVLEAAAHHQVRRFIHTSTVNTLGVAPEGLGDEDTPFDWAPYRLGYMDSKRAAEQAVMRAVGRGLRATILLPGTLFGPGDVHFNAGSYIRAIARFPVLLAPPGGTTVAHVEDVAVGHLAALDCPGRGERYILGGQPMSYLALFRLIAEVLERPKPVATLPEVVMRRVGWLAERLGDRLGRPEGRSLAGLLRAASAPLYYSSCKAESALGWSSRPVREAIEEAVAWYRRNGLLPG